MKKRIFLTFFFVAFFLLGFYPTIRAGAIALATVTATFIPPTASPTNALGSCPIGTPAGWGTYTPSPLWLIECGECSVTATPTPDLCRVNVIPTMPAMLPGDDSTPQPTSTLLPFCVTPSPTVSIPTSTPEPNYYELRWVAGESDSNRQYSYVEGTDKQVVRIELHVPGSGGYWNSNIQSVPRVANPPVYMGDIFLYVEHASPYINFEGGQVYSGGSGSKYWGRVDQWNGSYTNPANTGDWYVIYFSLGELYIPSVATETPTPEPTSTPFLDTGYCSYVVPPVDDFGFELFVDDGDPFCNLGWQEFEAGSLVVPAVQICFQPSQFGVITLFGSPFEIGTLALGAAGAFIWRFFRTV